MTLLRLQVAILVLIVLAASGQCVAACAGELCRGPATPCRHHPPSKQNRGPQTCTHSLFVAEGRASTSINARPAPSATIPGLPVQRISAAVRFEAAISILPGESPPTAPPLLLRI